ncbi:MAG: hypothetical protein WBV90_08930, partial [Terrimicrobiaceae bacterium]
MKKQLIRTSKLNLKYPFHKAPICLALMLACALPLHGADKKIVVGFSQIGAESGWRTANSESIKSEAAKR